MNDLISRRAAQAIPPLPKCYREYATSNLDDAYEKGWEDALFSLNALPTIDPVKHEPLTDKEKRIFLAAMYKERKVCEEVDKNTCREAYEDSLVWICKEIERKVKAALWTI